MRLFQNWCQWLLSSVTLECDAGRFEADADALFAGGFNDSGPDASRHLGTVDN
jgi:hypothetical protein